MAVTRKCARQIRYHLARGRGNEWIARRVGVQAATVQAFRERKRNWRTTIRKG